MFKHKGLLILMTLAAVLLCPAVQGNDEDVSEYFLVAAAGSDAVYRGNIYSDDIVKVIDDVHIATLTYITWGPDGRLYIGCWNHGSGLIAAYKPVGELPYDDFNFIEDAVPAGGVIDPEGLEFGPDGNLYVCNYGGSEVKVFDGSTGSYPFDELPPISTGSDPHALRFGPDGYLYVGCWGNSNVEVYDISNPVPALHTITPGESGASKPSGINFKPDGNILVSYWGGDLVLEYEGVAPYNYVGIFTDTLGTPCDIAMGPDDNVYITDYANNIVAQFPMTGGSSTHEYTDPGLFAPAGLLFIPNMLITLSRDIDQISQSAGGMVTFTIQAGVDFERRPFFLLGSMTGTHPGTILPGGAVLPLVRDQFFNYILDYWNYPILEDFRGYLDLDGAATARFMPGAGELPAILIGRSLYFAFTTESPYDYQSNVVTVEVTN